MICLRARASRRSPVSRSSSHPSTMNPRSEYTARAPGGYSSGSRAASTDTARRSDAAPATCRQKGRWAGRPELWQSSWRTVTCARSAPSNSGRSSTTGDSSASRPAATSRMASTLVMAAFVRDATSNSVSRKTGRLRGTSWRAPNASWNTVAPPDTTSTTIPGTVPSSVAAVQSLWTGSNRSFIATRLHYTRGSPARLRARA